MQRAITDMEVYVNLPGIIDSQKTGRITECIIHSITGDCREITLITRDPDAFTREDMELMIFLPLERSPVKCTCKISSYRVCVRNDGSYSAKVFIIHTSRIDRRRLELLIDRKRAFTGSRSGGYIYSLRSSAGFAF